MELDNNKIIEARIAELKQMSATPIREALERNKTILRSDISDAMKTCLTADMSIYIRDGIMAKAEALAESIDRWYPNQQQQIQVANTLHALALDCRAAMQGE